MGKKNKKDKQITEMTMAEAINAGINGGRGVRGNGGGPLRWGLTAIGILLLWFCGMELVLVPLNPAAPLFWVLLILTAEIVLIPSMIRTMGKGRGGMDEGRRAAVLKGLVVGLPVLFVLGLLFSMPIFHAREYAAVFGEPQKTDFSSAIKENNNIQNIAIVDTKTAEALGERKLGSLEDVVSQYSVGDYTTIVANKKVSKAAPLEYDGFFRYTANRNTGTPGYMLSDPVTGTARLVRTEKGLKYVPSSFFLTDLMRHIYHGHRTALLGNTWFEVDEEGTPVFVTQKTSTVWGLGGSRIDGIIVTDAVSGEMKDYALSEVPTWVDTVYDGYYIAEKYDDYGQLSGGFFNTLFAKKGCKHITTTSFDSEDEDDVPDFGYVADENDIWVYTGVTSAQASDHSDIGMLMVNERTGEARYMAVSGADEQSAMEAANGELQQYGYKASFPTVINVDGQATYIMVMTDNNNIVKNYAMVNLEDYSKVAVGDTETEVFKAYRSMLGLSGKREEEETVPQSGVPQSGRTQGKDVVSFSFDGESIILEYADGTSERHRILSKSPGKNDSK